MLFRHYWRHLLGNTSTCPIHRRLRVIDECHLPEMCILVILSNTKSKNVVTVGGKPLEETDCFTYVGSKINKTGGTEEDTKARIQKARVAFLMLSKIWK